MVTQQNGLAGDGAPPNDGYGGMHICPTRIDRTPVLFAHKVSKGQCQDRQRGHYHKCFTCAWNNAWLAARGAPTGAEAIERRSPVRAG